MPRIALSLLGSPRLERDGEPIAIDRQKALALLAYLTITNTPQRRDTLAALFWSDFDQSRARAAVRRALASLNKALPGTWWDTDRETIAFDYTHDQSFWLDVDQFRARLAACGGHSHPLADVCPACLAPLTEAVALYRGDFLSGFTLRDAPGFDDWQLHHTENLRRELAGALERLAWLHTAQASFDTAIHASRRWLSLDPLNELAHRQVMLILAQSGERHAALRQYENCVRMLERELGLPPEAETIQLYEAIKTDQAFQAQWTYSRSQTNQTARPAIRITGPLQTAATSENTTRPVERLVRGQLIGRDAELESARTIWQRVSAGEARVLIVSGEPGIGKSRLAREIVEMTGGLGAKVLTGQCHPENTAPYAPISQIVRGAFATHGVADFAPGQLLAIAPELAARYPEPAATRSVDPQTAQRLLFESAASFIDSFAQKIRSPLLLLIEDIHWADTGTLHMVRHLARRAAAQKISLLILLTHRDAEADLDEARGLREVLSDLSREGLSNHIRLGRFNYELTGRMLAMMLDTDEGISLDFSRAIFSETEGNPFFIEELCKALIDAGDLYFAGGHWRRVDMESITLPQNVRSAILSRVEKLPSDAQELLRIAAVLGREFDIETIQSASELDDQASRSALGHAERAQLINEVERDGAPAYTFAHALIPFALRQATGGLRRQRIHARVADALERLRPDDVEALAYHFVAAGVRSKSVEYSRESAARAVKLYAYHTAIGHLQTALEMLDASRDARLHIGLLESLADLHAKVNEGVRAIPIYLEAVQVWRRQTSEDPWLAVRLHRKIGEVATGFNRFSDYQRLATTVRSSLEAGLQLIAGRPPHPETVRLLCALSRVAWYVAATADWEAAERHAAAAVAMGERLGAPEELSAALEALSLIYGARGLYRERVDVCLRRLALSQDPRFTDLHGRILIHYELGRSYYSVGEYEAALVYAGEAENLSAAVQDVSSQVNAMNLQSQCLFPLDRWDELIGLDDRLRAIQTRHPFERLGVAMCFHSAVLSSVMRLRGDADKAELLREEAYGIMTAIGGPPEQWVRNQRF